jgi:hypothetical protein
MTTATRLTIAALAAALGALVAPAFAQNDSSDMQSRHVRGISMGHMGQDMMGGGMMASGMMASGMMAGCADMMQSMNNGGDGRPNSQWQKRPDNGG